MWRGMTCIHQLIPSRLMLTHQYAHSIICGLFWVWLQACCARFNVESRCSYGNEQIQVKQIRWMRDRWRRGRVGNARVEKYVLRERVSGQVDWELEISCQTQDLCRWVWKVPVCLPALCSTSFHSSAFFSLSLDGIDVNRWWQISPPLLPCSITQGIKIKRIWQVPKPMPGVSQWSKTA